MDNLDTKLTPRIRKWLNDRQISDAVLQSAHIGFDGRIVIPVFENGKLAFNKYRRDPRCDEGPKYTYDSGSHATLFGIDAAASSESIVICEGEFDCLVLRSKGIPAVTSTGGAGTFKEDWVHHFLQKEVFVCFDNDKAGEQGIMKVCRMIPHAKVIPLPPEIGEHGDVTDFFVKLGKTADDFKSLMSVAEPLPPLPPPPKPSKSRRRERGDGSDLALAKKMPLEEILEFNSQGFAKCPIHAEKTASLKKYHDNRWWCYGCGVGGDSIDLVMMKEHLTMPEAIKRILQQ